METPSGHVDNIINRATGTMYIVSTAKGMGQNYETAVIDSGGSLLRRLLWPKRLFRVWTHVRDVAGEAHTMVCRMVADRPQAEWRSDPTIRGMAALGLVQIP
jgi:hypothetical protein